MKMVKMGMLKEKEKENAINEVRILASIDDKHIIGYKEAVFDEDSVTLCIIMEFAASGDIQRHIKDHSNANVFEYIYPIHRPYSMKKRFGKPLCK
jgi:NIMA (never in mitosis gene a)-related kinase